MTPSSTDRDLPKLLGRARELTTRYQAGGTASFDAYRELLALIFGITVMDETDAIKVHKFEGEGTRRVFSSIEGPLTPLRLRNGAFLRFNISAFLGDTSKAPGLLVLKIADEHYQYQLDKAGEDWLFRYDYQRDPVDNQYPPAHLHIRADPKESAEVLGMERPLERAHFPTGRVSVPAIIRLLVEQFRIDCEQEPDTWRPVLAQVEEDFQRIAHQPISGPTQ